MPDNDNNNECTSSGARKGPWRVYAEAENDHGKGSVTFDVTAATGKEDAAKQAMSSVANWMLEHHFRSWNVRAEPKENGQ